MSEPTSSVVAAASAGGGALIVAMLGVEPQALLWASVGAFIGLPIAAQTGRLRAAAVYVAVVLSCALLGTLIAVQVANGAVVARNSAALVLAMGFHPILSAAVGAIPALVDGMLRKAGLKA